MLTYAMLLWVGIALSAPTWYWWCWGIAVGITFLKFVVSIYKAGKKQADDE